MKSWICPHGERSVIVGERPQTPSLEASYGNVCTLIGSLRPTHRRSPTGYATSLMEEAMTAIVRVDRNGTIQHWNSGAEDLFGFTEFETVGNSIELIIPPPSHACHGRGFAKYIQTGTSTLPEAVVTTGRHKTGRPVRIQISITALGDDHGRISGVEGVMIACRG